jgi:hypothetical protein
MCYYFLALDMPLPVVEALCTVQEYYVEPDELKAYLQRQRVLRLSWRDSHPSPHWFAHYYGSVDLQLEYLSPWRSDDARLYFAIASPTCRTLYVYTRSPRGEWAHSFIPDCYDEPPSLSPLRTLQILLERALAHSTKLTARELQELLDYLQIQSLVPLSWNVDPPTRHAWHCDERNNLLIDLEPTSVCICVDSQQGRSVYKFFKVDSSWQHAVGPYSAPPSPLPLRTLQLILERLASH